MAKAELDDSVTRVTSAVASGSDNVHPDCIETKRIEEAFDWTEELVHDVIEGNTSRLNIHLLINRHEQKPPIQL